MSSPSSRMSPAEEETRDEDGDYDAPSGACPAVPADGGWAGLVVAGTAFIVPATLSVAAAAWAYVRYGALPAVAGVLYGVKPVVIAIVIRALWGLGRSALKTWGLAALGLVAAVAVVSGVHELAVLVCAGLAVAVARGGSGRADAASRPSWPVGGRCLARRASRPRLRAAPRRRSGSGRCSWCSRRSARCSSGAGTCCWRFSGPTSSSACTG